MFLVFSHHFPVVSLKEFPVVPVVERWLCGCGSPSCQEALESLTHIGPGLTVINGMSYNSQAKVISFYYEIIPLRTVYCKGYNWNFTTGKPKNWLCRIGDSPLRKPKKRIKMGAFAIATAETWKLWRTYQRTNILEKLCWASCVGPLSLKSSMDLSVSGDRIFPEYWHFQKW